MTTTVLWRATSVDTRYFGRGSFWTPSRARAEWYTTTPGFGGPAVYRTEVPDSASILDLRHDPWQVLGETFRLDRDDYDAAPDHELFADLVPVLASSGANWAPFRIGMDEEWIRLDDQKICR
ncbi:hypothetical protein PHK61_26705 [Actinomycetospora lutea]|uniref:hypothetical protein n=1 Tax=Actinomycetospora lutea TaxID=663604 RepID=UPI002367246D|nr:hypothetical protein [Actinomycetospora lutea]MDD7942012.1 hypothetical protein [Actinomycetospora lutea]